MLFNSLVFVLFFAFVLVAYWLILPKRKSQNLLLLAASYFFYGWWDWRFLSLLLFSSVFDYWVARRIEETDDERKRLSFLWASVASNLGILGVFKYFDFFADSLVALFALLGWQADSITLDVALPVGISFYTFQTLGYTIDVFRRRMPATRDIADFALYVSFFPQLVAGPIERASYLIPQIEKPRSIDVGRVNDAVWLILWGYFKKVFVADNAAKVADSVFNGYAQFEGLDLLVGALAFTAQIYGDFSGYSDIARGVAKLLGFDLMVNFRLPYFARDPSDFWRRWHISLSSWLRDYLYISIGGNRRGTGRTYRNLFLTMLLGGLWHGAAWNFVLWGAYHGLLLVSYRMVRRGGPRADGCGPLLSYVLPWVRIGFMFCLTVVGWILFRCNSVDQIVHFFSHMGLDASAQTMAFASKVGMLWTPVMAVQIAQHWTGDLLIVARLSNCTKALVYAALVAAILLRGVRDGSEFIYFQF